MSDHKIYIDNVSGRPELVQGSAGASFNTILAWQPSSLSYVAVTLDPSGNMNVTGGGGGGGGGPVTVANGADVAQGATTDVAVTSDVNGTNSGKLRGLVKIFASVWDSLNGRLKVDGSAVTQPISAAALPLPAGAATSAGLTTINTTLGAPFQAGGSIGNTSFSIAGSLPTGTNAIGGVTQSGTWNVGLTGALPAGSNKVGGVTIADGDAVTVGTKTDAKSAAVDGTSVSLISLAKQISFLLQNPLAVTQSGGWSISFTAPQHVIVDSATLGTVTVTGGLTDTQLRASAVPVSLAALPALAAGAAIVGKVGIDQTTPGTTNAVSATIAVDSVGLAKEAGGNLATAVTKLTSIDGHITKADTDHVTISGALPAGTAIIGKVGIDAAANAVSATLATDSIGLAKEAGGHLASIDTTLAEIAIDTDNLVGIATTQATAAKQDTGNTSLAAIKADLDTVVTNTTGLSTSANQTTELASLATIAASTPALGAAATAASAPVNLASDQYGFLTQLLLINTQILAELRALRLMQAAMSGIAFDPLGETLNEMVN